jgi:16S rRNA (uracil1498-N3)-methyltransferase
MRNVYLENTENDRATLTAEELHHLTRVLRKPPGYEFVGFDGKGKRCLCILARDRSGWFAEVVRTLKTNNESLFHLHLVQTLIKKDKFEWVLQKAVELGVSRITPVKTWRTEVELTGSKLEKRLVRWRRIILEAVKQSGRSRLPILESPLDLADFLDHHSEQKMLVLDENGDLTMDQFIQQNRQLSSLRFFIGPEGGWDDRDRDIFDRYQVPGIQLGRRVLRTETAAVAAVSILQYHYGDLSNSDH